ELSTALDVTFKTQVLKLFKTFNTEENTYHLLIKHYLGVVSEICYRVVIMYDFLVVELGTTREILKYHQHSYTRELIRSLPKITGKKQKLYSIPGTVPKITTGMVGCRFATRCELDFERCTQADPPIFTIEGGRLSRCFLHDIKGGEVGDGQAAVKSSAVKKIL